MFPERAKTAQVLALDKSRRKRFGIGNDDVIAMVKKQRGCAICHAQMPGGRGDWHVDHDHVSNATRGILCAQCNVGLGHFGDDIKRLESAVEYLKHYASVNIDSETDDSKSNIVTELVDIGFTAKNESEIIQ
jgi:hypothetical protein